MGATFGRIKNFVDGDTILASETNAEFNNILTNLTPAGVDDQSTNDAAMQATADPYPAASIDKPTDLKGELERLRYVIKQITGGAQWYIDPDNTVLSTTRKTSAGLTTTDTIIVSNNKNIIGLSTGAASKNMALIDSSDNMVLGDVTLPCYVNGTSINVDGLVIQDGGISDGSNLIKTKIIDFTGWNMDTTASKSVAHGLTYSKIKSVTASVTNNAGTLSLDMNYFDFSIIGGAGSDSGITWDATNVNLYRSDVSLFDAAGYNAATGSIVITYVV